ncbi:hypothetical protein GYA93_15830 [Gordonia desulfuricans]|uniref:Major capsid protein n=1 Tax=Gordonia desulfuricans TaxID=89051 RepID=A0A7K3LS65_9ACTN|nr:hypothetical protein [Gordonia desulfuricans]NDK91042.1 hypothetical protein [Gordonia desulfuricans]
MAYTYPPAAPTISGDKVTISTFLNSPTLVSRRIRELAEQRFIADALLTARLQVSGGAVLYEQGETIFSDRAPESVAPGSEYPLTTNSHGTPQLAKTEKWGQDSLVTDESISRQNMDPVNRALTKQVNHLVKTVDSLALSAIASVIDGTNSAAAAAVWDGSSAKILSDVFDSVAKIRALNDGFEPDTLVVTDLMLAKIMADKDVAAYRAREDKANPVYTGDFPVIGGVRILASPNLPAAKTAYLVDTAQLGGMADEKIGGPGYSSQGGVGVEAKSIRDDDRDQWRIRARRVTVPIVLEPKAVFAITGAMT